MSIAEYCDFCKCKYSFEKKYFTDGQLTCSSCSQVCGFFIVGDSENEPRSFPINKNNEQDVLEENFTEEKKESNCKEKMVAETSFHSDNDDLKHEGSSSDTLTFDYLNNMRTQNYMYKNDSMLIKSFSKVDEVTKLLNLDSEVIEKTKENLKTLHSLKKFSARTLISVVVATIFNTSKQCNQQKNFRELYTKLKLTKEEKNEAMRLIGIFKANMSTPNTVSNTSNILGLVRQFCDELKMDQNEIQICLEVAENICEKGFIEGKMPNTIAAACICSYRNTFNNINDDFLDKLAQISSTYKNTIANAFYSLQNTSVDFKTGSLRILLKKE